VNRPGNLEAFATSLQLAVRAVMRVLMQM
jgi:hypothetical protein